MPQVVVAATLLRMNPIESLVDLGKLLRMREVCTWNRTSPQPGILPQQCASRLRR